MANQIIKPDTVHGTTGYSHAVRAGNTLYVSGQVAQDRDATSWGGAISERRQRRCSPT
jgi:enamine deaminase RidA (YjgF/YER057c/UK114 family)